jgi:16S rRNA (cytidine1402-2'-O)-methyltransferase
MSRSSPAGGRRSAPGVLRIIATPLGNIGDLSPRAREVLASAHALAAEDTRRTRRLLELAGLPSKEILSYFAPREREKARAILARLESGQTIALVTDGGTPGVSDPGAVLVGLAAAHGIRIEPIPGPSAVTLALSVSPLARERFVFEGFLPSRSTARRRRLSELADEPRPIVCFEAPHRLAASLADLRDVLGARRRVTLVREATKLHEEIVTETVAELAARFAGGARGEVVLVIEGGEADPDRVRLDVRMLLQIAQEGGLSPAQAARTVARITGLPRNRLMRLVGEEVADPPTS